MRKDKILEKLKVHHPDQIEKLKRVIDLCVQAGKSYDRECSHFLSPDLLEYIPYIMSEFRDLDYELQGGYTYAEYKRLVVYPDFMTDIEDAIELIEISYSEKYGSIAHRDVLGSLIGLGLKREVIGDILVEDGLVRVLVIAEMADYILKQIHKIGRVKVNACIKPLSDIKDYSPAFELMDATVKSNRLDSIIARGFNISRSKASDLIKRDLVKLNHNICHQVSKELSEDTLISVRGYGRISIEGFNGLTRKDRHRITIKKFI